MTIDTVKLRIAMARACMNTHDLAKAAEMPLPTINRVMVRRSVRPATAGKVARALGVDVTEILVKEEA